ncbi:DUF1573 domain-containing protein [Xanthocytophaga flava]|uniref:DUF1573 domain-containing protein n=1 Tax=Xanthocytophaga flava TaxID=3048013 RepID=UPI0028D047B0|nr:DUF1573 domain-containing protein [Xanthocytophaga flavus]MDJ1467845.1 DUF1573 domain-containing protein [Xanthocytophaga flavus]
MKVKYLTLFILFVSVLLKTQAQGIIKFAKDVHDFSTVTEGKVATHDFEFTNDGNAPIIISNVTASCGCTTPFWTHEPVLPGKKGKISASYNSNGRPGAFTKTITVTSNASNASLVLTIKGTVVPKPKASPEELANSPSMKLETEGHNFGKIEKAQTVVKSFTFTNTGKTDLYIKNVASTCGCVTFKGPASGVKSGEKGTLELRYSPRTLNQQNERVTITTNDLNNSTQVIMLQATVVESLAQQNILREQKRAVPF